MSKIHRDIINLEKYLNSNGDILESEEEIEIPKGLKGNITIDEIREIEQTLLYFVLNKSNSVYSHGLKRTIVEGLNDAKRTVSSFRESKYIQTAMTFFGTYLDMRPFKYGENINTSYEVKGSKVRMYDAIVESCNNMISQYEKINYEYKVNGVMLLFTDGEEYGSKKHTVEDARNSIREIRERNIRFILAAYNGVDLPKLAEDLEVDPIPINNCNQLKKLMEFVSRKAVHNIWLIQF